MLFRWPPNPDLPYPYRCNEFSRELDISASHVQGVVTRRIILRRFLIKFWLNVLAYLGGVLASGLKDAPIPHLLALLDPCELKVVLFLLLLLLHGLVCQPRHRIED